MPSVSVIVPVYQAEEFLNACVASVTARPFPTGNCCWLTTAAPMPPPPCVTPALRRTAGCG